MDPSKESPSTRDPVQEPAASILDADTNEYHVASKPRFKCKLRPGCIMWLAVLLSLVLVLLSFGGVFDGNKAAPKGLPSRGDFNASTKPPVIPKSVPPATRPKPAPKPAPNSRSAQNRRPKPQVEPWQRVHPGPLPKLRRRSETGGEAPGPCGAHEQSQTPGCHHRSGRTPRIGIRLRIFS